MALLTFLFKFLDINECLEVEGACKNGRCINELGSYYCVCPQHFTQVFEGTTLKCIGNFMLIIDSCNKLDKVINSCTK